MTWIKTHALWASFNLTGLGIAVYTLSQGSMDRELSGKFDSGLANGTWAIRFLLICLAISPVRAHLG